MARRAARAGVVAFALTDHDSTAGVAAATETGAALGVRVVPGCEFSVKAPWGELHVLGYFLPPGEPQLEAFLTGTRAARRRRAEQMVDRLERLGLKISLAAVESAADGGAVGRPHVARVLVERGESLDINDAFARYLARGRPGYVEKPLPALRAVTELVHAVGGVAVAAHLGDHGSEGQIREFQAQGLDGLEVRHPSHSPSTERRLSALAERLGLAVTGGSDWHGDTELGDAHAALGGLDVPLAWLEQLEQRRARSGAPHPPSGSMNP